MGPVNRNVPKKQINRQTFTIRYEDKFYAIFSRLHSLSESKRQQRSSCSKK